nr:immunoglobulin light chain junction region [Macaca mulatta]MOW30200.1 immunoglobulin light chain junction region [Macaca mulatta]
DSSCGECHTIHGHYDLF